MAHTTRYGNTYSDEEWAEVQEAYRQEGEEATRYFELKDELIAKAAGFLNRQFSDVPAATFKAALNTKFDASLFNEESRAVKFTSQEKANRFESATNWIFAELKKAGF